MYDEDGPTDQTRDIADRLIADGYGDVRLLAGGFAAWVAAQGKTQSETLEQPVPK